MVLACYFLSFLSSWVTCCCLKLYWRLPTVVLNHSWKKNCSEQNPIVIMLLRHLLIWLLLTVSKIYSKKRKERDAMHHRVYGKATVVWHFLLPPTLPSNLLHLFFVTYTPLYLKTTSNKSFFLTLYKYILDIFYTTLFYLYIIYNIFPFLTSNFLSIYFILNQVQWTVKYGVACTWKWYCKITKRFKKNYLQKWD